MPHFARLQNFPERPALICQVPCPLERNIFQRVVDEDYALFQSASGCIVVCPVDGFLRSSVKEHQFRCKRIFQCGGNRKRFFRIDVRQILYFPAGLCSRKQKDGICDLPWKSTFLKKAKEYGRDIVPVFFNGRNSAFFYRLAKLRKALGIKFNIEMMFLPDEMFRQRGNSFELYFGEPIPISSIDSSKSMNEWVETIRNATYKLKPAK